MGASQSTDGSSGGNEAQEVKTSYYELLEVERSATEEEIKKAYRRKALTHHPDRNYGLDIATSTALFAEIQHAYQVLSDPQERAWYDAHEYDILRGGDGSGDASNASPNDPSSGARYEGNMKVTTADEISRMMGRFRSNVKFDDSPSGFYGYLREVFETLAKEEDYATQLDGTFSSPVYPSFGHKDDIHDDVVRDFYSAWMNFSTRKSFAWKDKYRTSEAPDRRVRRIVEKENKRCREDGIREFNEAVRTLVAFVRKRDPRWTPKVESEGERERKERERSKVQAQAARARAAKLDEEIKAGGGVPEWAMRREGEGEKDEFEGELGESSEESEEEMYECVACRKTFKSERQWEAHEKSKKHQKAVWALKKKMRKDNAHLNLDDEDPTTDGVITPVENANGDLSDASIDEVDKIASDVKTTNLSDDDDDSVEFKPNKPITKPKPTSPPSDLSENGNDDPEPESEEDEESDIDDTHAPRPPSPSPSPPSPTQEQQQTPKLGKAAQKRLKKAEKQAAASSTTTTNGGAEGGGEFDCKSCSATFPSKTKLFDHLKSNPRHAAPISVTKGAGGGGGKKGKKKK